MKTLANAKSIFNIILTQNIINNLPKDDIENAKEIN